MKALDSWWDNSGNSGSDGTDLRPGKIHSTDFIQSTPTNKGIFNYD